MVNPGLLDSAIVPRTPEALVYEPRGGTLRLVALEYVVDRKAWHDAGNTGPPKLFGRRFSLTTKNPFGVKPFYALHAWVWRQNPSGWLQPWTRGSPARRRPLHPDPICCGELTAPRSGAER